MDPLRRTVAELHVTALRLLRLYSSGDGTLQLSDDETEFDCVYDIGSGSDYRVVRAVVPRPAHTV